VQLTPGYILHHHPYRDTSRILEVLSREFGRLTVFARGVRGPKAKLASHLQPFQPLLLSWSGRGESPQLTGAEPEGEAIALPSAVLMSGFYINELLLKLTTRHDPLPGLFDLYHDTLGTLKRAATIEPALRIFEKRLLQALGYGLDLETEAQTGGSIEPDGHYLFHTARGMLRTAPDAPGAIAGFSLISLARERFNDTRELDDARRLLRSALSHVLEGRELSTRNVARALARRESRA
jgi:DNA repair protein RecO (recombination protein O)